MLTNTVPNFISNQVVDSQYSIMAPEAVVDSEFSVCCVGREVCAKDYTIERKTFKYHAIEFIVSGRCELTINGKCSEVSAGSFFIYGPGVSHRIRAIGDEPLEKYFVDFTGSDAVPHLEAQQLKIGEVSYVNNRRWIRGIYEQLLECSRADIEEPQRLAVELMHLLFVRLGVDQQPPEVAGSHAREVYGRCRQYMSEHYITIQQVSDICTACHVSRVHLFNLFRTYESESPFQLLIRLKVGHAVNLMLHGESSVRVLSDAVGYADSYHFSRVFKRVIGMSPRSYMATIQQGGGRGL